MTKSMKALAATIIFIAPVLLGWAYTSAASVGDDSSIEDEFGEHTIDEFTVDGYLIGREGRDGVITMSAIGPDGSQVALADLPPHIATEVEYFRDEWNPAESELLMRRDGAVCYDAEQFRESGTGVVWDENGAVWAAESYEAADGSVGVVARHWDDGELSGTELAALHDAAVRIGDLPGGTELGPC